MSTTKTVLQGTDTATHGDLYVSFELGDKKWKVTASDGRADRASTAWTPATRRRS